MREASRPGAGVRASALAACFATVSLFPTGALGDEGHVERALDLVNAARQAEGLEALSLDEQLREAAEFHAEDMLGRDYYDHVSPEGEGPRDRYLAAGGSEARLVLENIALCEGCPTPPGIKRVNAFHDGWMDSPEHRDAILDPAVDSFGFAMASEGSTVHGVQKFAGPGRPRGLQEGEREEQALPEVLRERALQALNEVREAEGRPPLEGAPELHAAAEAMAEAGRDESAQEALPEDAARSWGSFALLIGECSGCGRFPTEADVDDFVGDWNDEPQLRERLIDEEATHLGFALTADGEGRKAAAAVLGQLR